MKTKNGLISLLAAGIIILFSCKKESLTDESPSIIGDWKWLLTYTSYQLSDSNPKTPINTGINEQLELSKSKTWCLIRNNIRLDSGTYSIGHGTYSPDPLNNFSFDSILYFKNGVLRDSDYYKIYNDTLVFASIFRGIYLKSILMTPFQKIYVKEK